MSKHTPTPWAVDHDPSGAFDICAEKDASRGILVVASRSAHHSRSAEMIANGEFIVKAVNAHDALVDALSSLRVRLEECAKEPCISAADAYDSFYRDLVKDALAKVQP